MVFSPGQELLDSSQTGRDSTLQNGNGMNVADGESARCLSSRVKRGI